jgi:phosphoribosylamine--glycine ligase
MASKGYPQSYEKGFEMDIPEDIADSVFVAGAKKDGDKLLTNGGRVLGVTAVSDTLESAIEKSYAKVKKISFANAYYRNDIGQKALKAISEK